LSPPWWPPPVPEWQAAARRTSDRASGVRRVTRPPFVLGRTTVRRAAGPRDAARRRVPRLLFAGPNVGQVADLGDDLGVGQGRHVAQLPALGDVAEQPPHDLPRPGLRQVLGAAEALRTRDLPDHPGHVLPEFGGHRLITDL